ncbi:MAG: penicillin-binding transpeptidase domain-containing protein [Butyricicoccus pullicaecorum]|nr:PASTA domain-containing protein [Butyricicoccus pullicaecorum]MDO4668330.1 penicillin-binding transpeptidase domain-containing protein [Butyricicoccus pullicaecorum]
MPMKGPGKEMQRRMVVMASLACLIGFSAVAARLAWMQIYQFEYYNTKASSLQTRDTILQPKRGTIYDSNMTELAVSASTERVEIYPSQFVSKDNINSQKKGLNIPVEEQQERVARLLSDVLGVDYESVLKKAQDTKKGGLSVAFGVEKEVADRLREEIKKAKDAYDEDTKRIRANDGVGSYSDEAFVYGSLIGFVDDYHRYYPMGAFASQAIGFMTENENPVGQWGIERQYEAELAGSAGRIVRAANSSGGQLPVEAEQYVPAQDGNSVVLTIDSTIQETLEKQLETALADNPKARGGVSGIVMDVKTGELLALAELPDFDPNTPNTITNEQQIASMKEQLTEKLTEKEMDTTQLPDDEWFKNGGSKNLTQEMQDNKDLISILTEIRTTSLNDMWKIKPVTDKYEPGSAFKLVTVAAAYEEHAVDANSTFFCNGALKVDSETTIKCHKIAGHGQQTLTEALENSCNVAMMNIAFQLGADKFYEYFDAFGLLDRTEIDLPGERDTVSSDMHSLEALRKTKSTLATTSFGQRFKVSPIQMLSTVCAIVDDGRLKKPHIVKEILNADGTVKQVIEPEIKRQVVSAETSAYMREAMEKVVSEGTGQNAYVAGFRIGGKTATSELSLPGTPLDKQRYTASFVGVAPMDDPQIAVLIIISDLPYSAPHGGGAIAAPVVGRVMNEVLQYLGTEPIYDESETDRREMSTPRVIGMTKEDAKAAAERAELKCRFLGEGDTVSDQVPSAGQKIPVGSEMIIYLGDRTKTTEPVTVPRLIGRSPEEVESMLESRNLYVRRTGVASNKYNWQTNAIKQNPAAGSKVSVGTVIEVEFSNTEGVSDR